MIDITFLDENTIGEKLNHLSNWYNLTCSSDSVKKYKKFLNNKVRKFLLSCYTRHNKKILGKRFSSYRLAKVYLKKNYAFTEVFPSNLNNSPNEPIKVSINFKYQKLIE